MSKQPPNVLAYSTLDIDGVRYAVVRESVFTALCKAHAVTAAAREPQPSVAATELDDSRLASRLRDRRQAAGVSQAELARRADVRVETLNRIERGHTTPDFSTIRKLVVALGDIERKQAAATLRGNR
ncbi:MAG: multiprotein-bridging factor 1 family protein [Phycisphaerae bacterium]